MTACENAASSSALRGHWTAAFGAFADGYAPPASFPDGAGDVDCTGETNSIDAALLLQLTAGLVDSLACEGVADVNEDGAVTATDAALILQLTAGLVDSLACGGVADLNEDGAVTATDAALILQFDAGIIS